MAESKKRYDELENSVEGKEEKGGFHEKFDYFDELYKAAKKLKEESQSLLDWLERCERKEQIAEKGKTAKADLQDVLRMLDGIKSKNLLANMQQCLVELAWHRRTRANGEEAAQSEEKWWKVVGRDGTPMEQQALYLTVQEGDSNERMLIEGSLEDGKWYNSDGHSLQARGMRVIAWLPKPKSNPPEPYYGAGQDASKAGE